MSAFTITPDYCRAGSHSAPATLFALVVSAKKYNFSMRMLCMFGEIVANDDTGEFTWMSLGAPRVVNATEVVLRLHEEGFVYQLIGDHFTSEIVIPADPEDFKQMLREAAAIVADPAKHLEQMLRAAAQ